MIRNKICLYCKKDYTPRKNEYGKRWEERKYCSYSCHYKSKRKDILFICEECGEKSYKRSSAKRDRFCSRECMIVWRSKQIKVGEISLENLHRFGIKELNPNWKGGVTPINNLLRRTREYKIWQELVLKRDNYTCVLCSQRGGELHVDHIKPFSLFPELRFELSNGRTLCKKCHENTDTYGIIKLKRYEESLYQRICTI